MNPNNNPFKSGKITMQIDLPDDLAFALAGLARRINLPVPAVIEMALRRLWPSMETQVQIKNNNRPTTRS